MSSLGNKLEPISTASPIAIGGVGGSGTRVVAHLMEEIGFDMGRDLNHSLDDLCFTALFKRKTLWPIEENIAELTEALQIYLTARGQPTPQKTSLASHQKRAHVILQTLSNEGSWQDGGSVMDRQDALTTMARGSVLWGWKEPNTHILLPFLFQALPNMKYMHVIRNGLDMAYSANQNQLDLWGEELLGRRTSNRNPSDALDYWCRVNERLLSFLPDAGERILIIRFESLLQSPENVLEKMSEFLGLEFTAKTLARWKRALSTPTSLGRHTQQAPLSVDEEQTKLLAQFGYDV